MKRIQIIILAAFAACLAMADEPHPGSNAAEPPSDDNVSYALGMNLGLQIKRVGTDVDVDAIAQGIRDVLDGKPTRIQMDEIRPLFARAQQYVFAKRRADGEAFLAKNAGAEGVTTLPDGLQYRVIQPGTGNVPGSNDVAVINFRGSWIDGREFRHEERVPVMPLICPNGIKEALLQMKPGSKWRIFAPSNLAYSGDQPSQVVGFGSTLIYDLELISATPDSDHKASLYGAGRLGHAPGEDFLPPAGESSKPASAGPQPIRESPGIVQPGDAGK